MGIRGRAEGARAATRVMKALQNAKLGKDAVRTLAYSLQEEFDWHERRRVSRGYLASNSIEVRIDDVERVGEERHGTGDESTHEFATRLTECETQHEDEPATILVSQVSVIVVMMAAGSMGPGMLQGAQ